jgi:hypothetical protein
VGRAALALSARAQPPPPPRAVCTYPCTAPQLQRAPPRGLKALRACAAAAACRRLRARARQPSRRPRRAMHPAEMQRAGMIEEIMNDAIDSAIGDEDLEEETDAEVDKVRSTGRCSRCMALWRVWACGRAGREQARLADCLQPQGGAATHPGACLYTTARPPTRMDGPPTHSHGSDLGSAPGRTRRPEASAAAGLAAHRPAVIPCRPRRCWRSWHWTPSPPCPRPRPDL